MLLFSLVAGHVADRYDRRSVFRLCQIVQGAGIMMLALASFKGLLAKEHLLAAAFLVGGVQPSRCPRRRPCCPIW